MRVTTLHAPLVGMAMFAAGIVLGGGACGRDRDPFADEPDAPLIGTNDASDAPECRATTHCSSDLKRVIRQDCDGTETVVQECGPDFGCGEGTCVDACRSAEISKGSIGCSFATLPPDAVFENSAGSCFAAVIANVWDRPVSIHATLGAAPIDVAPSTYYAEMKGSIIEYTHVDGPIEAGKVAIVFLAKAEETGAVPCPRNITPALLEDPITHGTGRTRAFLLSTDAPVSAYSIWPYGGGEGKFPAATLLLPTSSWDTHYLTVSTWVPSGQPVGGVVGWPFVQVVAAEDGTEVRMRPSVNVSAGPDVPGVYQGQTQVWTLNRGDVLQIKQKDDTSGSPIETNKPVGLFGGADCTFLPLGALACDMTHQQIPAVSQWGNEYALVPYRPRNDLTFAMTAARENVPWRLVGAANGTKLTYDPTRPGGAPATLEAGEVATFSTTAVVSVRSQDAEHPFHAAMFMTGASSIPVRPTGDPEFVNAVPSGQFLDRYIFFADHTYLDTNLTLVRRKTSSGFKPVTLDCAGELTGWAPLDNAGEYEFLWLVMTRDGVAQTFPSGTCTYGRHEAKSDAPFSVHVWGTSPYASYGYAAGQGIRPLHDVKGPPVN